MLSQNLTKASHRYLALLAVLCMFAAQATAAVHSCGEAAAGTDSMAMHGDHSGHDMASMMTTDAGSADCCDQDCECPDASCSASALMIVASIELNPTLGTSTTFSAVTAAALPSQSHHFRPPIIA
jgi:hypothetical protein